MYGCEIKTKFKEKQTPHNHQKYSNQNNKEELGQTHQTKMNRQRGYIMKKNMKNKEKQRKIES